MRQVSKAQIQKIHVLLNQLGLIDQKKGIVLSFTNGRTDSTRSLTVVEALEIIKHFSKFDPREKHIRSILFLARKAGLTFGETLEDFKMNQAKINAILRTKGVVKKELTKMTLDELKKTHRQFEAIVRNNNKTRDNKEAAQLTENLLEELKITIQK